MSFELNRFSKSYPYFNEKHGISSASQLRSETSGSLGDKPVINGGTSSSLGPVDEHGQPRLRNYKLLIDPAIKKGHAKVYRYDGVFPGQPAVVPKDPRSRRTRIWCHGKKADLLVPNFKVDKHFVGIPPQRAVIFSGLNDNVDKHFLQELAGKFGKIDFLKIYYDPQTKRHTGKAKVTYAKSSSAKHAVSRLDSVAVMGNLIRVELEIKDPNSYKAHCSQHDAKDVRSTVSSHTLNGPHTPDAESNTIPKFTSFPTPSPSLNSRSPSYENTPPTPSSLSLELRLKSGNLHQFATHVNGLSLSWPRTNVDKPPPPPPPPSLQTFEPVSPPPAPPLVVKPPPPPDTALPGEPPLPPPAEDKSSSTFEDISPGPLGNDEDSCEESSSSRSFTFVTNTDKTIKQQNSSDNTTRKDSRRSPCSDTSRSPRSDHSDRGEDKRYSHRDRDKDRGYDKREYRDRRGSDRHGDRGYRRDERRDDNRDDYHRGRDERESHRRDNKDYIKRERDSHRGYDEKSRYDRKDDYKYDDNRSYRKDSPRRRGEYDGARRPSRDYRDVRQEDKFGRRSPKHDDKRTHDHENKRKEKDRKESEGNVDSCLRKRDNEHSFERSSSQDRKCYQRSDSSEGKNTGDIDRLKPIVSETFSEELTTKCNNGKSESTELLPVSVISRDLTLSKGLVEHSTTQNDPIAKLETEDLLPDNSTPSLDVYDDDAYTVGIETTSEDEPLPPGDDCTISQTIFQERTCDRIRAAQTEVRKRKLSSSVEEKSESPPKPKKHIQIVLRSLQIGVGEQSSGTDGGSTPEHDTEQEQGGWRCVKDPRLQADLERETSNRKYGYTTANIIPSFDNSLLKEKDLPCVKPQIEDISPCTSPGVRSPTVPQTKLISMLEVQSSQSTFTPTVPTEHLESKSLVSSTEEKINETAEKKNSDQPPLPPPLPPPEDPKPSTQVYSDIEDDDDDDAMSLSSISSTEESLNLNEPSTEISQNKLAHAPITIPPPSVPFPPYPPPPFPPPMLPFNPRIPPPPLGLGPINIPPPPMNPSIPPPNIPPPPIPVPPPSSVPPPPLPGYPGYYSGYTSYPSNVTNIPRKDLRTHTHITPSKERIPPPKTKEEIISEKVYDGVMQELKTVLQRDVQRKLVETSAFKSLESWWDNQLNPKVPEPTGITTSPASQPSSSNTASKLDINILERSHGVALGLRASLRLPSFKFKRQPPVTPTKDKTLSIKRSLDVTPDDKLSKMQRLETSDDESEVDMDNSRSSKDAGDENRASPWQQLEDSFDGPPAPPPTSVRNKEASSRRGSSLYHSLYSSSDDESDSSSDEEDASSDDDDDDDESSSDESVSDDSEEGTSESEESEDDKDEEEIKTDEIQKHLSDKPLEVATDETEISMEEIEMTSDLRVHEPVTVDVEEQPEEEESSALEKKLVLDSKEVHPSKTIPPPLSLMPREDEEIDIITISGLPEDAMSLISPPQTPLDLDHCYAKPPSVMPDSFPERTVETKTLSDTTLLSNVQRAAMLEDFSSKEDTVSQSESITTEESETDNKENEFKKKPIIAQEELMALGLPTDDSEESRNFLDAVVALSGLSRRVVHIKKEPESIDIKPLLPPKPTLPLPTFPLRTLEEDDAYVYELLEKGLDLEDAQYLKIGYERLQQVGSESVNDATWSYHPLTFNAEKPKGRRQKQDLLRVHTSGSARSEGYYKTSLAEKVNYLESVTKVFIQPPETFNTDENEHSSKARQQSRENRAQQRRLQSSFCAEDLAGVDILRFNKLKIRKKKVRFLKSSIHNWGLFSMEHIAADEMVIEYVGEVIRQAVADDRERRYEEMGIGSSYMFRIDSDTIIDATKCGNFARFVNHSCNPNCYAKVITVESSKKIVIYSKRDILMNEEITYDYKFPIEDVKIQCLCDAPGCRGTLN